MTVHVSPEAWRRCVRCKELKDPDVFPMGNGVRKRICEACGVKPPRACRRCGETRPAEDFLYRGYNCSECRALPSPSAERYLPRACFRCLEVKEPDGFPYGRAGIRREPYCWTCAEERAYETDARRHRVTRTDPTGRKLRWCKGCATEKDLIDDFYVTRRKEDGTPLYDYRCKACAQERIQDYSRSLRETPFGREKARIWKSAWRKRYPERYRAAQARYREKLKTDPERYAARMESQRMAYRLRRERETGVHIDELKRQAPRIVASEVSGWVPIEPFRAWLEEEVLPLFKVEPRRPGAAAPDPDTDELSVDLGRVAEVLAIDHRRLYAWRRENVWIPVESIRDAYERLDVPWMMEEHYPDLDAVMVSGPGYFALQAAAAT